MRRLLQVILLSTVACRPEFHVVRYRTMTVRLPLGDSILLVATGPIFEPNGDTGFMYEYHPYISIDDTVTLRKQALVLWNSVRPKAESLRVPFVVLRATTRFTEAPVGRPAAIRNYGFVLEKRRGGLWYFLHDSVPVGPR